jgi:hypothetical protein
MAEEERNRAKADLQQHEEELDRAQREHDSMKAKLVALERKIIVGGENLLEKAEEQVSKFYIISFFHNGYKASIHVVGPQYFYINNYSLESPIIFAATYGFN